MKKILLSILMLIGMSSVSFATPSHIGTNDSQCRYKLVDARAGLNGFAAVGFVEKQKFEDGNKQMGFFIYHNPKSTDPKSVDAIVLVLLDKRAPDQELTFVVIYPGPKQSIVFKREIRAGNKLGPCFEKSLQNNP